MIMRGEEFRVGDKRTTSTQPLESKPDLVHTSRTALVILTPMANDSIRFAHLDISTNGFGNASK